jgi:hypothetical protein
MTADTIAAKVETLTAQLQAQRHAVAEAYEHARALERGAFQLEGALAVVRELLAAANGAPPPEKGPEP